MGAQVGEALPGPGQSRAPAAVRPARAAARGPSLHADDERGREQERQQVDDQHRRDAETSRSAARRPRRRCTCRTGWRPRSSRWRAAACPPARSRGRGRSPVGTAVDSTRPRKKTIDEHVPRLQVAGQDQQRGGSPSTHRGEDVGDRRTAAGAGSGPSPCRSADRTARPAGRSVSSTTGTPDGWSVISRISQTLATNCMPLPMFGHHQGGGDAAVGRRAQRLQPLAQQRGGGAAKRRSRLIGPPPEPSTYRRPGRRWPRRSGAQLVQGGTVGGVDDVHQQPVAGLADLRQHVAAVSADRRPSAARGRRRPPVRAPPARPSGRAAR